MIEYKSKHVLLTFFNLCNFSFEFLAQKRPQL